MAMLGCRIDHIAVQTTIDIRRQVSKKVQNQAVRIMMPESTFVCLAILEVIGQNFK